ncbi:hypothetical protein GOODEAATRI_024948 [Goodea atripinnis]|uniref:Uncharacterized protein n=1 Tax=Goodea atripinnis TaxID=208336 RepID=A0ABV0MKM4_9TELE
MSASAGPTTPGAHLIPMLTSPDSLTAVYSEVCWLIGLQATSEMLQVPNNKLKIGYLLILYPEGTVGNIDFTPGDDDCVLDGFGGNVDTEVGAVSIICNLDVNRETVCILVRYPQIDLLSTTARKERVSCSWKLKEPLSSHLSVEPQLSSSSSNAVDGKVSWFVDDATQRLQTRAITFHLRSRKKA